MNRKRRKIFQKKAAGEKSDFTLPDINPGFTVLFGVFFVSFSVIAFELLITRISSLIYTYNYAFLAVSLAILGLGCGGIFTYYRWSNKKAVTSEDVYTRLSFCGTLFSASVILFLILILKVSLFSNLFLYFLITFIPFFFAGIILSSSFELFASCSFKLYFFDLIGAAAGALTVIFILDVLGAVNTAVIVGIFGVFASFLFTGGQSGKKINFRNLTFASAITFILIILFLVNIFTGFLGEIPVRKSELKDLYLILNEPGSKAEILESRWSAFGRTDLVGLKDSDKVKFLFIDGAAGTPMFKFDGNIETAYKNLDFLNMIFSGTFPFNFLDENQRDSMLIIGPGGGREIIIGLVNKFRNITGVEVNKDFIDIVKENRQYNGGIYTDFRNVSIINAEGRSYLEGVKEKFDVILIIQPFTKSSRSVEGYALTENYLLTYEAIKNYVNHLTDEGFLAVVLHNTNEIMRFITSALLVFEDMGINNKQAMNYLYTIGKEINPLIVLGKRPFNQQQSAEIFNTMLAAGLVSPVTFIPGLGQKNVTVRMEDNSITRIDIFNDDLIAVSEGKINLQDLVEKTPYNVKPVTDNRPFFFNDEKWVPKNLAPILIAASLINLVLIIGAFLSAGKKRNVRDLLVLAILLGFGFMLIEISFFNKLILFLGSPVYSLAIILGVLLASMGIGSITGNKIFVNQDRKKIFVFCIATAATTVAFFFMLSLLTEKILSQSFINKVLITSALLVPVGFSIGIPFPSAIKLSRSYGYPGFIPWLYGINGTFSVLGSAAAVAFSTVSGFSTALIAGSALYIIAAILFIVRR